MKESPNVTAVMVVLAGIVGSAGLMVWVMFDIVQRMIEYNYWR